MNMIRYAFMHLRRSVKNTCVTLLLYLTVLAVIMSVQQAASSRQTMLTIMADSLEITGHLADNSGHATEGLSISSGVASQFLDENGIFAPYVKDVSVHAAYEATAAGNRVSLIGITCEQADSTLRFGEGITYNESFDESIFRTGQHVCVIDRELEWMIYVDEEDLLPYVDVIYTYQSGAAEGELKLKLRVIGTADAAYSIFCPYPMLMRAFEEVYAAFSADSLSFIVRNNREIDKLRNAALIRFADPGKNNNYGKDHALVLQDARYLELISQAQKNLAIMQLMQPILYLCALGAGVMLVVMQMRGRKKEMAVIRSLGAGRLRVMAQSILEYALICLPVTLFALLVWRELSPMTVFGVWLAFMAGALCTIVRFSMIPLVKQIRELEE